MKCFFVATVVRLLLRDTELMADVMKYSVMAGILLRDSELIDIFVVIGVIVGFIEVNLLFVARILIKPLRQMSSEVLVKPVLNK